MSGRAQEPAAMAPAAPVAPVVRRAMPREEDWTTRAAPPSRVHSIRSRPIWPLAAPAALAALAAAAAVPAADSGNFTTDRLEAMGPAALAGKAVRAGWRPAVASPTPAAGRSRAWRLRSSRRTWPLAIPAEPAVMAAPAMVGPAGAPRMATAAAAAAASVVPVALRAQRPPDSVADWPTLAAVSSRSRMRRNPGLPPPPRSPAMLR